MATVYVESWGNDANDGLTAASPKLTIAAGLTAAGAQGTTIVGPGTYAYCTLAGALTGADGAPTTLQSSTKWGAIIECASGHASVTIDTGCDYAIIDGFQMTGAGGTGVYNRGENCIIRNNWMHDLPDSSGYMCDADHPSPNCVVEHNLVEDCGSSSLMHGIYASYCDGTIIRNNLVRNCSGRGIIVGNNDNDGPLNCSIYNNICYGNTSPQMLIRGRGVSAGACGHVVANNTLSSDSATAGALKIELCDGARVANNILFSAGESIVEYYGNVNNVYSKNLHYVQSDTDNTHAGAEDPDTNLITNGTFEDVSGNDFASWTETASLGATIVDGGAEADSGSHCVQINMVVDGQAQISQAGVMVVGGIYLLTFRAKCSVASQFDILAPSLTVDLYTSYSTVFLVFTATSTTLTLKRKNNKEHTIWIDNVSLTKLYSPGMYSRANNMYWPKYGSRAIDAGENTYKQAVDFWGDTPPDDVQIGAVPYNQQIHPHTFLHDPFSKAHLKTRWHHWRTRYQRLL